MIFQKWLGWHWHFGNLKTTLYVATIFTIIAAGALLVVLSLDYMPKPYGMLALAILAAGKPVMWIWLKSRQRRDRSKELAA